MPECQRPSEDFCSAKCPLTPGRRQGPSKAGLWTPSPTGSRAPQGPAAACGLAATCAWTSPEVLLGGLVALQLLLDPLQLVLKVRVACDNRTGCSILLDGVNSSRSLELGEAQVPTCHFRARLSPGTREVPREQQVGVRHTGRGWRVLDLKSRRGQEG